MSEPKIENRPLERKNFNVFGTLREIFQLHFYQFDIRGYEGTYIGVCSQPVGEQAYNIYPDYYTYSAVKFNGENREEIIQSLLNKLKENQP